MNARSRPCVISECDNEATGKHRICKNCRSGLYYWRKKKPSQVLHRRKKLTIYQARLSTLIKEKS